MPRTSSFSPNLQLSASVKFAPFATRVRRGYVRDSTERDLGLHLANALKGVIIPDRWPKSAVDVAVTVLEGGDEDDELDHDDAGRGGVKNVGLFNILAGCINVAMAALADAGIDCLDLLAGGVAASVVGPDSQTTRVLDPSPAEHKEILAACVVGFLASRDEIVEVWADGVMSGQQSDQDTQFDNLLDHSLNAARGAQNVLKEVLAESALRINGAHLSQPKIGTNDDKMKDVEMRI